MGLNIETTKLIWILFNEVAGIILALFKSLQQKENTICPLCAAAIERREEIITKNIKKINEVLETLKSNFIDNQGDFAELLVKEDNEGVMADLIEKKINEKPEAVDDAIFSIIQYMAVYDDDTSAAAPSFSNYDDDTTYYDTVIIELTIKNLDLPKTLVKQENTSLSPTTKSSILWFLKTWLEQHLTTQKHFNNTVIS